MLSIEPLKNQKGGALLIVLVTVVILGLGLGMTGSTWKTLKQREREEELLWRGTQIRRAIESYVVLGQVPGGAPHSAPPGGVGGRPQPVVGNYPLKLEELLKDPRRPNVVRHLRKLYKDPITGEDWELIKDPGGRIKGVKSSSKEEPFKKDGFPPEYEDFRDAESYSKWEFVFEPGKNRSQNTTAPGTVTLPGQPTPPTPSVPARPNPPSPFGNSPFGNRTSP